MKGQGFTIIEQLIVIAVVLIMLAGIISTYTRFAKEELVSSEAARMASTLRLAKNKAMAEEDDSRFKVVFTGSSYSMRRDDGVEIETMNIDPMLELVYTDEEVVFQKISGESLLCDPCQTTIRTPIGTNYISNHVMVFNNGVIDVTE